MLAAGGLVSVTLFRMVPQGGAQHAGILASEFSRCILWRNSCSSFPLGFFTTVIMRQASHRRGAAPAAGWPHRSVT